MKKMKILKNTVYSLLVVFLVMTAGLLMANKFGIGDIKTLVVSSGSMEPSIPMSSIVITAPSSSYNVGDVVTFRQSGRDNVLVTHRISGIVEGVNEPGFVTKGDANEEADGETVSARNVVGKVVFSIPYIGALVSFAKTQVGFIALIVVPAVAIVYSEILSIKNQLSAYFARRRYRKIVHPIKI